MQPRATILSLAALLASCGSEPASPPVAGNEAAAATPEAGPPAAVAPGTARWDLQSNDKGAGLTLLSDAGAPAILLSCAPGGKALLVNVPGFRPIGSEERLSFGGGGDAVALVADTAGDKARRGVSATGAVPAELARILGGPLSASYGTQKSGPHAPPPPDVAGRFVAACGQKTVVAETPAAAPAAGACMMQDGKALAVAPLRAVGTEPFWGARIEGRCVTYSDPDDQKGTRVWTRYTAGARGGGTWAGKLGDRTFELRVRAKPGCSDGMSDKAYPLAVDLALGADRRTGCAGPS
jgi:uncharacterized membrane protein